MDVLGHTQLLDQGDQAAGALSALGIRSGDYVAVLLPMCLESVVVTLACIQLGATRVTLPVDNDLSLVRDRIHSSGTRVVITAGTCRVDGRRHGVKAGLDRALWGCPAVRHVLVVPQLPGPVPWTPGRDRWWHEALRTNPRAPRAHPQLPRSARPYPEDMSSTPKPSAPRPESLAPARSADPVVALVFDDPLERRSADDADHGWGERPEETGSAADLLRFLDEKPPHHL